MSPRSLFLAAGILALTVSPAPAADPAPTTASLTITVHNIADAGGDLRIGVYDEANFAAKAGTPVARKVTHARGSKMTITFDGIPPGTYGAKVLQDINQNGQFDMGLKGVEPFGFSNDPEIKGGLPPFSDVKFTVSPGNNSIDVTLH
ncbi:MAG TPA: DUF2141 domain-containing protein [Rhizomicrobium sp.]|nr:DUF2141 domain-containing protein [Rhizomicrobium sp.]